VRPAKSSENVTFHREAARLMRENAKAWSEKGRLRRSNLFKGQASWHDTEADRLEDNEFIQERLQEVALLFARECLIQGMAVGYLTMTDSRIVTLSIDHTYLGLLSFSINSEDLPNWVPIYPDSYRKIDQDAMYDRINRYLRPIENAQPNRTD